MGKPRVSWDAKLTEESTPTGARSNQNHTKKDKVKEEKKGNAPASEPSSAFAKDFRGALSDSEEIFQKMASSPYAETGLAAIALVIRSRDGPRFVYHYPRKPNFHDSRRETRYGTELDEEPEEEQVEGYDDSDDSDLEDGGYQLHQATEKLSLDVKKSKSKHQLEDLEDDDHFDSSQGEHIVPWERLGEFETTDLESILTPSRAYHKKKFELSLDPLNFVSYPMHIREDGLWKKKKAKKAKKAKKEEAGSGDDQPVESEKKSGKGKEKATESDDGDDHGGMTMFNVVFVLNVPADEENERIAEIYEHIIKKFNKALNHAQASSNYVWKESEKILSLKEKAKEERRPMSWLWNEISAKSTLAAAIRDVFLAISNNKIATVQLATTPPLDLSLQIPVPSFLTSLPTSTERAMPGLLVTTANPFVDEEGNEDPTHLNKHFALILLDDEDTIIREIQNDNTELSAPLIECIQLCKPTLSFLQVAQANSVELPSLLTLAQHLIYWRRAIAFPPLHARETYIVSPNSDLKKLPTAGVAWKKAFPLAPDLHNFLAHLSAAPRPYKTFFPSKNHRQIYLDMLGWLIRGGWVTQLRTFAWILVWPEIVYEVGYQLKAEALQKKADKLSSEATSSEIAESTEESGSGPEKNKEIDPSAPMSTEQAAENARLERLAVKAAAEAASDAAEFAKMPLPIATANPSCNNSPHIKKIEPYVIIDPHKVSHEESLYIAAIGKRLTDPKVKECWGKFSKYLNGKEPLEMIGLREGMKRKETWAIILAFQENLLITKHW